MYYRSLLFSVVALFLFVGQVDLASAQHKDTRCYEIRTYTSPEGKLDELDRRFRTYSRVVFAKYQMDRVGFWIPMDNPDNQYIYILSFADCEDRDPAWDNFLADPFWKKAHKRSIANGKLVTNVDSRMMETTDFSPTVGPSAIENNRVFELRTYTATTPDKLDDLLARFRNHTMEIFEKHGMTNVGYWLPKDNDNQLVYILAYPSRFAREEAWQDFGNDPEWQSVYEKSVEDGKLVEKVESVMMRPTDYSPIK